MLLVPLVNQKNDEPFTQERNGSLFQNLYFYWEFLSYCWDGL